MSLGNHTQTKHSRHETIIHVGNVNTALIHITQLTKVVSIHLAIFVVIVQFSFQYHKAAANVAIDGRS